MPMNYEKGFESAHPSGFNEAPVVLTVDDSNIVRSTISKALEADGYTILEADSGESALGVIEKAAPDLFLLDIVMPGMDGLELCRRIKEMPRFQEVPVLFVTSTTDMEPHWKTFEVGAVDYIPKPFHPLELRARVKTHLNLLAHMRSNKKYAMDMESLAHEQAQQIIHSDRLATLGVLTAGIIHEIKNPITYISNNEQFLRKCLPELKAAAEHALHNGYEGSRKLGLALESIDDTLSGIAEGVTRSREIAENIRKFSRGSMHDAPTAKLGDVVKQALAVTKNRLKYTMKVEEAVPDDLPPVRVESGPLSQVFVNLFLNAADAVALRGEGTLKVEAKRQQDEVVCTVTDTGPGMDKETLDRLWEPFFSTKPETGTGLGLSISRQILEHAGGSISVRSAPGQGTSFTLRMHAA